MTFPSSSPVRSTCLLSSGSVRMNQHFYSPFLFCVGSQVAGLDSTWPNDCSHF